MSFWFKSMSLIKHSTSAKCLGHISASIQKLLHFAPPLAHPGKALALCHLMSGGVQISDNISNGKRDPYELIMEE